jgi:AcrR family transcriptional regulator
VDAGTRILVEKGAGALTLRACARAAGVSHAAPHHHFDNAAGLLAEIAARGFEAFVAALDAKSQAAPSPESRLSAMCRAYVDFAMANASIYALMFRQPAGDLASPHLKEAATRAWQQLESAVAAVIGNADPAQIVLQASFVWAQVHGLATLLLDRRLPLQVDRSELVENTARGLIVALRTAGRAG